MKPLPIQINCENYNAVKNSLQLNSLFKLQKSLCYIHAIVGKF